MSDDWEGLFVLCPARSPDLAYRRVYAWADSAEALHSARYIDWAPRNVPKYRYTTRFVENSGRHVTLAGKTDTVEMFIYQVVPKPERRARAAR